MQLKKYEMKDREGPGLLGRYRLGHRPIYRPTIKTTSEGESLLIEELRHPSNPGVPVSGIKIKGFVRGQEGNTCLFDEKTFSKEEAIAIAREFPEYHHLLPSRS